MGTKDDALAKLDSNLVSALRAHQSNPLAAGEASGPLVQIKDGQVVVSAIASADTDLLQSHLEALGMEGAARFGSQVSGRLPLEALDELAGLDSLQFARAGHRPWTNVGLTTSQGDIAMRADVARSTFGVDGGGVSVGVLSDTFDDFDGVPPTTAADDVASGDLPSGNAILDDTGGPGIDEGRAIMQLIHDVAPGSDLGFHTAFLGEADFALGIEELAGCPPGSEFGCTPDPGGFAADVIVDDVIYLAEPMFQDGIIAQAVDTVKGAGVSYFSSAGNQARRAYESAYNASGVLFDIGLGVSEFHDFDAGSGFDPFQRIKFPVGSLMVVSYQWDSPFFSVCGTTGCPGGSPNDMDIFLVDKTESVIFAGSFGANIGGDAVEVLGIVNDGSYDFDGNGIPDTEFNIMISKFVDPALPDPGPDPGAMKYVVFTRGPNVTIDEFDTASGTLYGHANAAGAEAVGAAFYHDTPEFGTDPPLLEFFSSAGPTPILFEIDGTPTVEMRDKPEIVAPDGTNTTFFFPGVDLEPDGFPNFRGTSASAPHAAAVAALMLEANSGLSPDDVYETLEATALDMNTPGFDFDSGFGFVQADSAVQEVLAEFDDLDIKKKTEVKLKKGTAKDEFEVEGKFQLGDDSDGIDPVNEDVYLRFDRFRELIPAGSFKKKKGDKFEFKGSNGGITKFEIELKKNGEFKIKTKDVELDGIDLENVDFVARVGDDFGQALLEFDKKGKFKKQK